MKSLSHLALLLVSLLLVSCVNKQGGACAYQAFNELIEITALQQNSVETTGSVIENFDRRDFDTTPAIGERYRVQGKQLIRGSCTPITDLQLTKMQ